MTTPSSPVPRRVGLILATVQFCFALCWTVYVIYLPQLAEQVGLPRHMVLYVLMLDQIVFVAADYACGVAADRSARFVARLGPWILGATVLSSLAFLALPLLAPVGSVTLLVVVTLVWTVTSSALRAPPLVLIGRHAARPSQPWLVALSLFGLGVAAALAPYLAITLRGVDPRIPFVLAGVALVMATTGIVWVERALMRARTPPAQTQPTPPSTDHAAAHQHRPALPLLAAAVLVALAFQVHAFVNSAPLYLRHVEPGELSWLFPVFWVGFNLLVLPSALLARRWGAFPVMGVAALVAALTAGLAQQAGSLPVLVAVQLVAGAAWGCLLMSAFCGALALGHTGHEGRYAGALSSVLALAALLRIGMLAQQWHLQPGAAAWLGWLPVAGWLAGSALLLAWWLQRGRPMPS